MPPIEIDREAEYKVEEIKGHHICNGEVYQGCSTGNHGWESPGKFPFPGKREGKV